MAPGWLVPSLAESGWAAAGEVGDGVDGAGFDHTVERGRAAMVRLTLPEATTCQVVVESEGNGAAVWYGSDLTQPRSVLSWSTQRTSPFMRVGTPAETHRIEHLQHDEGVDFVRGSSSWLYQAGKHHVLVGSDPRNVPEPVAMSIACESPGAAATLLAEGELFLADSHDFAMPSGVALGDTLLVSYDQEVEWAGAGSWLAGYVAVLSAGELRASLQHADATQTVRIGDAHGRWYALLGAHSKDVTPVRASQDAAGGEVSSLVWAVTWDSKT